MYIGHRGTLSLWSNVIFVTEVAIQYSCYIILLYYIRWSNKLHVETNSWFIYWMSQFHSENSELLKLYYDSAHIITISKWVDIYVCTASVDVL